LDQDNFGDLSLDLLIASNGETRRLFDTVIDQITDGVLITDSPATKVGHKIIFANKAMCRLMGYKREELLGASPKVFQGVESDSETLDRVRASLKAGVPFAGRITNQRKDGTPIHMEWQINPIFSPEREIVAWFSVQTDITPRLALEETANTLDERLDQISSVSGDGVLIFDRLSDSISISGRLRQLLEIDEETRVEDLASYINYVVPEHRNRVQAALLRPHDKKDEFEIRHDVVLPSGKRKLLQLTVSPEQSDKVDSSRMAAVVVDITEQEKLSRRLLQAEEIANIGSWEVDLIENTVYWSPQLYRIHGYEPYSFQPTIEQGIAAYHPDDQEMVRTTVSDAIDKGLPFQFEAIIIQPDGTERNVLSQGLIDFSSDGSPVSIFGVFVDRTAEKRQEQEITRSQRLDALGKFVGGVAHDFNNLLHVIMGNLEILEDLAETPEQKKRIENALVATTHGSEFTQSLLSFAKRAPLRAINVQPVETIEAMLPLLDRVLPSNVQLSFSTDGGAEGLFCDPTMLEACLMNLVINARDALPQGGSITIDLETIDIDQHVNAQLGASVPEGRFIVISVSDDGVGMSVNDLRRANEPFFTTKPSGKGTGLGLPRVLGFAEQSGGVFRLYSELGKGTSAKIILPVNLAPAKQTEREIFSQSFIRLSGKRILLVEDQPEVRDVLTDIMVKAGLDVAVCVSGDEAYDLYGEKFDFDLLISDVVMPGNLQGPDLVRRLRSEGIAIPVIFISGYPGDSLLGPDHVRGTDVCITKPVSKELLLRTVWNELGSRDVI